MSRMRDVLLLTGPPAAGKTTLARQLIPSPRHGVIIDLDDLETRFGIDAAPGARRILERKVRLMSAGRAVVVRSLAHPQRRAAAARRLGARVTVLDPGIDTALGRSIARGDSERVQDGIRRWYELYSPADCDGPMPSPPSLP